MEEKIAPILRYLFNTGIYMYGLQVKYFILRESLSARDGRVNFVSRSVLGVAELTL